MVTANVLQRSCPVCGEVLIEDPLPGLPAGISHLEDVLGVPRGFMSERQRMEKMEQDEKTLHDHLAGHPPEEWLPKLMEARRYGEAFHDWAKSSGNRYLTPPWRPEPGVRSWTPQDG